MFVLAFFIVVFALSTTDARVCRVGSKSLNIPNCKACGKINPKCTQCNSGFRLNKARTKCIKKNSPPPTPTPTQGKVCKVGSNSRTIPNCVACGKQNPKCTKCRNGYKLNQGRTKCLVDNQPGPITRPPTPAPSPPNPSGKIANCRFYGRFDSSKCTLCNNGWKVEGGQSGKTCIRDNVPLSTKRTNEKTAWLTGHNTRRIKYLKNRFGVRGDVTVSWSSTLENQARAWARELADNNCQLKHDRGNFGENLASGSFPWDNQPDSFLTRLTEREELSRGQKWDLQLNGHFTQVIWRGTKKIGCAIEYGGPHGCVVAVCRYSVPGNCNMYMNENNWLPLVTSPTSGCGSLVNAEDNEDKIEEEIQVIEAEEFTTDNNNDAADDMPGWAIGLVVLAVLVVVAVIVLLILTLIRNN